MRLKYYMVFEKICAAAGNEKRKIYCVGKVKNIKIMRLGVAHIIILS